MADEIKLLESPTPCKWYFHHCDTYPTDGTRLVVVHTDINWAFRPGLDGGFPIYKPCCHFHDVNADGSIGVEVNFSDERPIIIIPDEE